MAGGRARLRGSGVRGDGMSAPEQIWAELCADVSASAKLPTPETPNRLVMVSREDFLKHVAPALEGAVRAERERIIDLFRGQGSYATYTPYRITTTIMEGGAA